MIVKDSIEKALSPVFLITFFWGLGIFKHPLDQLKYYLSLLYVLTVWSVYVYVLYYTIDLFSIKTVFNNLINTFVVTLNLFVALISIIISICKHKKYQEYIRKFDDVDNTLEELGISKEYRRMQNFMRLILIEWSLISCMAWIYDSLLFITEFNDMKAILIHYVLNYFIYINTITDITFVLLLRYIGIRLDKVNDHIAQISEMEDYKLRCKWKKFLIVNSHNVRGAKNRKRVLWIVIHLHSELCRTARDINGYFGMQMTLQMMSYFIILIGMFHFQYYSILRWKQIYENNIALKIVISSYWWFIFYLIKLISLNYMCESVSTKAQKTKEVIHKLTNFNSFAEVREEIYQFVLQISLRPLKFSGLGLFHFGYDFIRNFFVWMITAVIFMAQMDFTPIYPSAQIYNTI